MQKTYNPTEIEKHWYSHWQQKGFFRSIPDERPSYTIVIPPPNVTGVLHMGHMLNNTIQDVLVRRARMQGFNALWVPGTDHASIATEAKVVRMLREQGILKSSLTREQFLDKTWEWKEKYGGIIFEQLKKLGASCDWERTSFTMDPLYYKAVIRVFVDMYRKGHVYRGLRMVNWDCEAQTTVSNEEVIYNEDGEKSTLYHLRYKIQGTNDEWVTIATTRPETILADTAIAVHPDDERFKHLEGKFALVPFINRPIPIIFDTYVEREFGTGCLKVTPAHDINDYEIGQRHNLPVIDIINDNGTLNELCQMPQYVGKDRFEVRKLIVEELKAATHLVKTEELINKVGRSERTGSIIEPKLSLQWFLAMKKLCEPALEHVMNDDVRLIPEKYKNTYRHWMENVRDWCLSRQLWWGHQIPAYYYGNGDTDFVVAETPQEALELAQKATNNPTLTATDLKQDPDVLDTWASSWLWPIAVFDGFENYDMATQTMGSNNTELNYYYPTAVLVTAPEILFFWVARMVIAGYEYMDARPFKDVYLTGLVRDKLGRKMSKSLGNSPDPFDLIAKYGADGVRTGMLFSSPAGNDLMFDESLCEQGSKFSNKIWNALRLIKGWDITNEDNPNNQPVMAWFESKFNQMLANTEQLYSQYRLSEALTTVYSFIWDDFCSTYLEMIKPDYEQPIDRTTYEKTLFFFEQIMKVAHPFMPFLTEEVYHQLQNRTDNDCIMVSAYPKIGKIDPNAIDCGEALRDVLSKLREVRAKKNIKPRDPLPLFAKVANTATYQPIKSLLIKKGFLASFEYATDDIPNSAPFMVGTDTFYVALGDTMDMEAERERLQKDLAYQMGFKDSVNKKLSNEKFVANANAIVIEKERQKLADAETKIKLLEESLASLN